MALTPEQIIDLIRLNLPDNSLIRSKLLRQVLEEFILVTRTGIEIHSGDIDGLVDSILEFGEGFSIEERVGGGVVITNTATGGGIELTPDELAGIQNANRLSAANPAATIQKTDLTVTVGTGGDFLTINEAIEYLSKFKISYINTGLSAIINLLTGFEMAEQVIANNGINLGWIEIVSEQPVVTIIRTSIVENTDTLDGFDSTDVISGAFMASNGSVLPRIGCVFSMDSSGSITNSGQSGIIITKASKAFVSANCGFNDCTGLGAHVVYGSTLVAPDSVWEGNGSSLHAYYAGGVRGDWVSFLNLQGANFQNQLGQGVMVNGASNCSLRNATINNSGSDGLQTGGCSIVHIRGLNSTNNAGRGVYASEGSHVRMLSTVVTGNGGWGVYIDGGARVNSAAGSIISNNVSGGIRCLQDGAFIATNPTIQNNTGYGCRADGGDISLNGGTVSGNTQDLRVSGGNIRLLGTVTTTSGTSAANNLTDSNVAAFNTLTSTGKGGIFGRGGAAQNRGTATIPSGSTSVVVTHGVDFTPIIGEVSVIATNSMNAASKFWITGLSATQFTINVNTDPTAGGATFAWNIRRIIS